MTMTFVRRYFWDLLWTAVFLAVALWSFAARAGDVAYVTRGTGCGVWQTGATTPGCTPSMPTTLENNDILIADVASSANTAHTCPTNCTGWTNISNAGATTGGRHSVWWYRMSSTTTPTAPTFGGPSTSTLVAAIRAYRGVWRGGTPFAGVGTAAAEAAGTTITGEGITTTSTWSMPIFSGGVRASNTFRTAGGAATDPPTPNTVSTDTYYTNGTTTSTVFFAHDGNLQATAAAITAPTIVQSASTAGRSLVYAFNRQPTTVSVSGTKAWATCNATPCTTAWATTSGATPVTLAISVVYGSAVTLNSVTDTASNVWTQYARGSNATDSRYSEVWATTSTASAITSVTMVWSGTPTSTGFTGYEILGVNHIGTTSTTSGASASELTSTITPTGTDSLVVWSSYYNSASTTRQWFDSARGSQWNIGGLLSGQPNKWGIGGTNQFYTQGESRTWGTLGTVAGQWCGAALNLAYVPPASAGEGFMRGWWGGLWTIPRRPILLEVFP